MVSKNIRLNYVQLKFLPRAVLHHGMFLLRYDEALEFVQECERENLLILGIDGLWLHGYGIQPDMGHDLDFTTKDGPKSALGDCWAGSIEWLQQRSDLELWYEIVCDGDNFSD